MNGWILYSRYLQGIKNTTLFLQLGDKTYISETGNKNALDKLLMYGFQWELENGGTFRSYIHLS